MKRNSIHKVLLALLLLGGAMESHAQQGRSTSAFASDEARINLMVEMPQDAPIPETAKRLLHNRLSQAVVLNGAASSVSRYMVVPVVSVLSKSATTTAPAMFVTELEVTIYVVDQSQRLILQQCTVPLKGIANSEVKATYNAITSLQARNGDLKLALVRGKEKIVDFYTTQCDLVLRQVEHDIAQGAYEEALLELESVPQQISTPCFKSANELRLSINSLKNQLPYAEKIEQATKALENIEPDLSWIIEP